MTDMHSDIHNGIQSALDEGELALGWTLTVDIVNSDGERKLSHICGGGLDGSDTPILWSILGMRKAGLLDAEDQLLQSTVIPIEEDEDTDS